MSRMAPPIPVPRPVSPTDGDAATDRADADAFRLGIDHLLAPTPTTSQKQIEALQSELESLRSELNVLRRRDETLKYYMTRLDEELRLAARLQQDFLPRTLPQVGPIHFHTLFRPAGYVSGDLFDVMRLDETHIGFFIVDAVGHGMPAALLTMFIKRALQTKEIFPGGYRLLPPEQTMALLNEALVEQNLSEATFATALYGYINTTTLEVTYSTGGHPPPLLLRAGEFKPCPSQGSLLGLFSGEAFTPGSFQLKPGDRLFLYSDGVEVGFSADQAGDVGQWKQELLKRTAHSAEKMLTEFAELMDAECGSLQPKDDLTMIVVEVR